MPNMEPQTLRSVLDISRRMAETRSLSPLLDYAMGEAIRLVGAERGYVVLAGPGDALDFRARYVQGEDEIGSQDGRKDEISRSIVGEVIQTRLPLVLRDASQDPKFSQAQSVKLLQIRSVMCVPLIARGETIGAIYVENRSVRGRFSEDDLTPLILFANQAAVAIENAMLIEELEARVEARTHELAEAKARIEQSWMEAVEANRLRTVLLSNLTHDLRAPLTIVLGALTMLQDGDLGEINEEQRSWIDKAFSATTHVMNLSNDLFDLSRMESGRLVLVQEKVRLADFLESVYTVAQGLPWPAAVKFTRDWPRNLPSVSLDPVRIQQVLLNLLSNALKFTREGAVVLYAMRAEGSQEVMIGVRDAGEGIAPERIEELFERFYQVDSDPERRRSSTGLGLIICRNLVEMHQGRIWVESAPGSGSDFKFTLPLA